MYVYIYYDRHVKMISIYVYLWEKFSKNVITYEKLHNFIYVMRE